MKLMLMNLELLGKCHLHKIVSKSTLYFQIFLVEFNSHTYTLQHTVFLHPFKSQI